MQTSQPFVVHSGHRAFRVLLLFYPSSLRSRFRDEMLAVFEDQVSSAWEQSGYRGVFQSWWRALSEILLIAAPARLDSLKIPVLSILFGFFLTAWFFAYFAPHCAK